MPCTPTSVCPTRSWGVFVTDNWKNTFDLLPDVIAIMDADHKIVRMNKAMAEVLEKPVDFSAPEKYRQEQTRRTL